MATSAPLTLTRAVCLYTCYVIFGVSLLYASGLPFLVTCIAEQTDSLPGRDDGATFYKILFPLGVPDEITDDSASVDLIGIAYLSIAIPFFILSILIETFIIFVVLPEDRKPLHTARLGDSIGSIGLGILQVLSARLLFLQWFEPLYTLIYDNLRLTDALSDATQPFTWWSCLIIADFLYYWFHRFSHQYSWMWTTHAVHHSSEEYNLTTALRQPALDFFAPSFLISSAAAALLFPWPLFSVHATFNLLYQFWIHTQLVPPLPWVETIFNTPSLHAIHHGRNIRALGKNYAAILIIWDRMFGTFEPLVKEGDDAPIYFGIIPQLKSYDPIFANLHHWHHMIFVQTRWQKWYTVPFRHWTPNDAKCPEVSKTSKMNPAHKFDPRPPTVAWKLYAIVQFSTMLFGVGMFLLDTSSSAEIGSYLLGDDSSLETTIVSLAVVLMALWTLSNVTSIFTLGIKGTISTRRSLLCGECVRHVMIVGLLLAVCLVPAATWGYVQFFLAFSGAYLCVNGSLVVFVRSSDDKSEGKGGQNDGVVVMGGGNGGAEGDDNDNLEAALLDMSTTKAEAQEQHSEIKNWSWYPKSGKYE
ncbi:hypothetical protein TrVE_jg11841 [Triparma verrucosa]|uniref:Fatty acid hydroxylase domain-containing protein n=1 Tax=Triparma verrucosa TaxID=1606542 RepID=A0A9W7B6E0_9STRA|nr:hypothetical protein TrVE_jg11841 [Triparma verrucosa]